MEGKQAMTNRSRVLKEMVEVGNGPLLGLTECIANPHIAPTRRKGMECNVIVRDA